MVVEQVEENVRVVEAFEPLSAEEEAQVLGKARERVRQLDKEKLWFLPEGYLPS